MRLLEKEKEALIEGLEKYENDAIEMDKRMNMMNDDFDRVEKELKEKVTFEYDGCWNF